MQTVKTVSLAVAAAAFALSANGKPAYWKCASVEPPKDYAFLIDVANHTADGAVAQLSSDESSPGTFRLNAQGRGPDGEPMLFTFSYPSGAVTGDGRAGASIRAQCHIPDESVAEFASGDRGAKGAPQPNVTSTLTETTSTTKPAPAIVPDNRAAELMRARDEIQERVRNGKLRQQQAARLGRDKFFSLFPEQAGNALLTEYFAYAEVIGEKVDHKKLTIAEGQYELARKASELQERAIKLQADAATIQAAATREAAKEAAAKQAKEEAIARTSANDATALRASEQAEQSLALQRQMLEQQQAQQRQQRIEELERQQTIAEQRRQELLQAGLKLLFPPRPKVTTCTGSWLGSTWVQNCF